MRLLVAACVALLLTAGAAAGSARRPALALVSRTPVRIGGIGFRPHERVVVRSGARRLVVRTSRAGRFVALVGSADRCSAGRVLAVGASGDRAVLRLPPLLCAPAATP